MIILHMISIFQGEPGLRGPTGQKGDRGRDATYQSLPGPKGDQGPRGEPGLVGIQGKVQNDSYQV